MSKKQQEIVVPKSASLTIPLDPVVWWGESFCILQSKHVKTVENFHSIKWITKVLLFILFPFKKMFSTVQPVYILWDNGQFWIKFIKSNKIIYLSPFLQFFSLFLFPVFFSLFFVPSLISLFSFIFSILFWSILLFKNDLIFSKGREMIYN